MSKQETFKEIQIGGLRKEELIQGLDEARIQFNDYAKRLMEHEDFSPPGAVKTVKLVKLTLDELGLEETCSIEDFEKRAIELGLALCPLYLAAFLRLEYLDQAEGPYLTIASPRLVKDEHYPNGFYLRNFENALWLRGYRADGFENWPAENEFIFIKSN